jgi:hypothetical protein
MRNRRACHAGTRSNYQALSQSEFASDWVGATETQKYIIRCVLHTGSGSMQLAGHLGGKLGKQITIGNLFHRAKNQVGSHKHLQMN